MGRFHALYIVREHPATISFTLDHERLALEDALRKKSLQKAGLYFISVTLILHTLYDSFQTPLHSSSLPSKLTHKLYILFF